MEFTSIGIAKSLLERETYVRRNKKEVEEEAGLVNLPRNPRVRFACLRGKRGGLGNRMLPNV